MNLNFFKFLVYMLFQLKKLYFSGYCGNAQFVELEKYLDLPCTGVVKTTMVIHNRINKEIFWTVQRRIYLKFYL